jgi:hypothetical protein
MGNEYRLNGGTLGTEKILPGGYMNGCGFASLALPSDVPVAATLYFAIKNGVGYFPTESKSLGVLDLVFADQIPDAGPCQNKLYHIQFKNVPILEREPAPVQTPSVIVTNPQPAPVLITTAPPAPEAAPGVAPVSLQVPANVPWFDSGVDLSAGEASAITATGIINVNAVYSQDNFSLETPAGQPGVIPAAGGSTLAPNLPPWSLIGKIGQFGVPFEIGTSTSFAAPASGRLYLSANDNFFPDNSGSWDLTVSFGQANTQPSVNFDYFHDQLAPFGTWVQVAGYGWCWHPDAAINADPNWRPYYDMGQWVYTDNGWFWQSDYTWGDIPFHYGNWIIDPTYGWLWVPGYTWGPAWVFWRQAEADGCIGWAPLPPGAVFINGGWDFHDRHYRVDFDFGLGEAHFAFIGYDHFHDNFFRMKGREYAFHVPRERIHAFYGRTVLRNDFRRDEHGRLINDGIGRDRIEQLTHHQVEAAHFEERNPVGDRNKLATQRIEEAHKQVGPPIGKPGEPGHELPGKPMEQPVAPAPVNKVFRPQVQMPKPTAILPKPAQAPQQALKNNKPQH